MTFDRSLQELVTDTSSLEASELLAAYSALAPEDQQKLLHSAQKLSAQSQTAPDADAHDVLSDADEEEVRRILSLFGHR